MIRSFGFESIILNAVYNGMEIYAFHKLFCGRMHAGDTREGLVASVWLIDV